MISQDHDPLDRKLPDEPRFVLLARDPVAAEMVTLWAALRKRDGTLVDAVVKRLKTVMMTLPIQPHKDNEHFWSASKVATEMMIWAKAQEQASKAGLVSNTMEAEQ